MLLKYSTSSIFNRPLKYALGISLLGVDKIQPFIPRINKYTASVCQKRVLYVNFVTTTKPMIIKIPIAVIQQK